MNNPKTEPTKSNTIILTSVVTGNYWNVNTNNTLCTTNNDSVIDDMKNTTPKSKTLYSSGILKKTKLMTNYLHTPPLVLMTIALGVASAPDFINT
ncbi:hypothetical protein C2G38_2217116 [Gigaspora rosea]|uniref:Uncharacterized protein n=1 Tax=Gigaspora rosea TaxID=44941 RepID=A0A397UBK9_9GLOM|nr:hypothetical protein C2G38_2217116 [Gigaspora rosea]